MFNFFAMSFGSVILGLLAAALQRRFSPETLANGFMDVEKGKEIAPTVFEEKVDA